VCNEPGDLARSSKARNRRKELQHRIARLERLYESVLKDGGRGRHRPSPARAQLLRQWKCLKSEGRPAEENFVLRDDVFPRDVDVELLLSPLPRSPSQFSPDATHYAFPSLKDQQACRLLLDAIPSPQSLKDGLLNNRYWWSDVPALGFDQATMDPRTKADLYASWILTSAPPTEVAKSMHMILSLLPDATAAHILALIDDIIIADADYAATLTGLEVALMQCRWYLDLGDFAKSWTTVQRAVRLAARLDLHAARATPRDDVIWTGLFQADRLQALMLATPCGIGAGVGVGEFGYEPDREVPPQHFLTSLGVVAGKMLVDGARHVRDSSSPEAPAGGPAPRAPTTTTTTTTSSLRRLDDELVDLRARFPAFYWHVDPAAPRDRNEAFFWMTKVINRLHYYLVRIVLHAPGLFRALSPHSPVDGQDAFSRAACLDSARELLSLFRIVRARENEEAYANKILDLYAFVAAAVLAVAVVCTSTPNNDDDEDDDEDWAAVLSTTEMLREAVAQPFGKLAAHSHRALQRIIDFRRAQGPIGGIRAMVPFVGVVVVARTHTDRAEPAFEPWFLSSSGDVFDRHLPAVHELKQPAYDGFLEQPTVSYSNDLTNEFFDPLFTAYVPAANILYSNDFHTLDSDLAWVHEGAFF
jgi:hypothetical protein